MHFEFYLVVIHLELKRQPRSYATRSSLENYNRFQTKMGKVYTRFQTKKAQNPTLRGDSNLYGLSVADPDLQIRRGGGGHADPEIMESRPQKKFFFGPSGLILV